MAASGSRLDANQKKQTNTTTQAIVVHATVARMILSFAFIGCVCYGLVRRYNTRQRASDINACSF